VPERLRRELYVERGETSRFIDVSIDTAGQLMMSGVDIGEAPLAFYGDSDYEFWVVVEPGHKGRVREALLAVRDRDAPRFRLRGDALLLALIEERYKGDPHAVDGFKTFLREHDIPLDFGSWI
jgi:hypothetical protein